MVSRDEVIHHYGTGDIATNLRLGDGRVEIREINMKADVLRLAAVILVATASAAHAADDYREFDRCQWRWQEGRHTRSVGHNGRPFCFASVCAFPRLGL
jgi:hypothetical protein